MNSRVLIVLAIVFIGAALVVGWWGISLVTDDESEIRIDEVTDVPEPDEPRPDEDGHPVVFAVTELEPGQLVGEADIHTETLRRVPPLAFSDPEEVIGLRVEAPIQEGELLTAPRFSVASQVSRGLLPGERAVAISVDDVIGVGGYLSPGDRVDVMLYLSQRGVGEIGRLLHPNIRVLAYGEDLAIPPDGVVDRRDEEGTQRQRGARTAVLALPEEDVATLLLADSAGTLRLAARPAIERRPDFDPEAFEAEWGTEPAERFARLRTLHSPDDPRAWGRVALTDLLPVEAVADEPAPEPPPVYLHRGTQRETVRPGQN
ncbi:Flp pilus assembly protein CpaB [Alkalilimnicola ehrlichii MLHE-1]|uniref:Flp pilus assembly protein CpaB-like protein n=1 Tax=Alkalilimnicola ehrlichii (strain ATCC BAA-1101 / DSM 17681 / MLHE-1) TaxID=187272 RepID=Q0A6N2_ALKEH|nr:Flp pilus assembly protein CpaB [Alkalilimnicola ehrlichii]ABI57505.1 Flp pilus assembly protein CpaB-like protein [Alkalilimnicola ehrlichii MLHE-1]